MQHHRLYTTRTPARTIRRGLSTTSAKTPRKSKQNDGPIINHAIFAGTTTSDRAPPRSERSQQPELPTSAAVVSGRETLDVLRTCEELAESLMSVADSTPVATPSQGSTPTVALLELDENSVRPASTSPPSRQKRQPEMPSVKHDIDRLSDVVHSILLHPAVFISPAILQCYVEIQTTLQRPQTLPEIFTLYTVKPAPRAHTSLFSSNTPNPNRVKNAIPTSLANQALDSAIAIKDLSLTLAIIETTFATPAFRRSKIIYKASPAMVGAALTPMAMYTLAAQFSAHQALLDPQTATSVAFAGLLAYVGFTASIGLVAVTTANDQMDRVTWAPGIPLRERWVREQERAAIDRVAAAWGFRETWRRGEEEGEEWDNLREWIGRRGMMLDRTSLMEGME